MQSRQNEREESGDSPVTQQFPDGDVCQSGLASASSLEIDELHQVEIMNENIAQVATRKTDYPRAIPRPKGSQPVSIGTDLQPAASAGGGVLTIDAVLVRPLPENSLAQKPYARCPPRSESIVQESCRFRLPLSRLFRLP
jgi:hypothetical protein